MNMVAIAAQMGPCKPAVPGQGFLEIQGWGASASTLEFTLMENQNRHYLQGDGSWGNAPYWFSSSFVPADDSDALRCHVGEEIVGALLRCSSSVMHMLQLREASDHARMGRQVLRMVPGLQLPTAGHTPLPGSGGGLTPPPPIVQPPVEEKPSTMEVSTPEPEPASQPVVTEKEKATETTGTPPSSLEEKPKKTWFQRFWWLLLLIALLLAAGAGAAWWFLFKAKPDAAQAEVPEPPAASAPAPAAPSAAAPCSAEAMQADGEMAFVQNCIAQSPAPDALLQTIAAAKQNKHCGIAQRLYANRSQAGDLLIAEAYAKEYDPKFHQASDCFPQPEADTAVYWWETILSFNAQHALAQERMKELKP